MSGLDLTETLLVGTKSVLQILVGGLAESQAGSGLFKLVYTPAITGCNMALRRLSEADATRLAGLEAVA